MNLGLAFDYFDIFYARLLQMLLFSDWDIQIIDRLVCILWASDNRRRREPLHLRIAIWIHYHSLRNILLSLAWLIYVIQWPCSFAESLCWLFSDHRAILEAELSFNSL